MAIILVPQPGSTPSDLTDWTDSVESLKQYNLGVNKPVDYNFDGNTIKKGVLITIGGSNYYCNADTAISGTASDYVQVTSAGVATYVSSLSGVSWNDTYNFYADSSGNAYIFNEAKAGLANTVIGAFAEHGYFAEMEVMGIASLSPDSGFTINIPSTFYGAPMTMNSQMVGRPNVIEFSKVGYTVKGNIGASGNFEMAMGYNRDYTDGVHRYFDSTENAHWFVMNNTGYYMQYAPPGSTAEDMWYDTGSQILMHIDNDGKVACGKRSVLINPTHIIDIYGEMGSQFKIKRSSNRSQSLEIEAGGNNANYYSEDLDTEGDRNHNFYSRDSAGDTLVLAVNPTATTVYAEKFRIDGDLAFTTSSRTIYGNDHGYIRIAGGSSAGSLGGNIYIGGTLDAQTAIRNETSVTALFTASGDVGLSGDLTVDGSASFSGAINPTSTPVEVTTSTISSNGSTVAIPRGIYESIDLYYSYDSDAAGSPSYTVEFQQNRVGLGWVSIGEISRNTINTSVNLLFGSFYGIITSGGEYRLKITSVGTYANSFSAYMKYRKL